ncbi:MAG TPA: hypothetical protein VLJ76_02955 [Gaiellaceae bacterium]|nr:hypothetical protein [Gaiellaceae bacterium]
MTALVTRARSRRVIKLGLPLLALVAIALALLLPGLGSARTTEAGDPSISGGTSVGDTLTGDHGSFLPGAQSFKYNWRRCPPDGGQGAGNCEGIIDGPDNTYVLQSGDVGFTIRLQVKAWTGPNYTGDKAVRTSNATGQITGTGTGPTNTGLPAVTGTAAVGQTLTTNNGTWASNFLASFSDAWLRCDASGNNCAPNGTTASTYVVGTADQGSTIRSQVIATNPAGTTVVMSAATALVPGGKPVTSPPPPPPPAPTSAGCPSGKGAVPVTSVTSPARLVIDRQLTSPLQAGSGQQVTVRYRVSDTCGQVVQGALVYATAVPFGQLSTPAEAPTGANGFVSLTFQTLPGFPLGAKQRSVQIFVRARKAGEDLLAGISARRLFEIPISR